MRLMRQASVAGNLDAMVEFAIAQFNGDGVDKDEAAAAQLFLKAAHRGSPIAQNRLARILMAGRGMPADADRGDQMAHRSPRPAAPAIPNSTYSPPSSRRRCATPPDRRPRSGCRPPRLPRP